MFAQEELAARASPNEFRPTCLEINGESIGGFLPDRNDALLRAFAEDADETMLEMHLRQGQSGQL